MKAEAREAAGELLADPAVASMVDRRTQGPHATKSLVHPEETARNRDGLHFTRAGQKRLALEVLKGWSQLQ